MGSDRFAVATVTSPASISVSLIVQRYFTHGEWAGRVNSSRQTVDLFGHVQVSKWHDDAGSWFGRRPSPLLRRSARANEFHAAGIVTCQVQRQWGLHRLI